jgi:transposase
MGLIRKHFPEEHIADDRPGRKPIPARKVLEAVLWILNTGAQWHMLPQCYPNYKTVHRRFQRWCQNEVLRAALTDMANALREQNAIDESECYIDATFASAKGGDEEIGPTRRRIGMNIMAIVDRHGLPLAVTTHAANHHEVTLVRLTFDFYMIEAKPENLIGDRAYDSDPLDETLRKQGTEMIAPHRSTRKLKTQEAGGCVATSDVGSSSASLRGFNGNGGSWFAGNITRPTFSASCSLRPYASCSSNFETGSSIPVGPQPFRRACAQERRGRTPGGCSDPTTRRHPGRFSWR